MHGVRVLGFAILLPSSMMHKNILTSGLHEFTFPIIVGTKY